MPEESRNGEKVYSQDVVIDSDTTQGKRVQEDIVAFAQALDYSEPALFAIRLAVEEALFNAIKHGNGSDPSKKVRISYRVNSGDVFVRVEDEGPGFDPQAVPDPTNPEFLQRPFGRGLMLMRYYMSEVVFRGRGNVVEMVKRFDHVPSDDEDVSDQAPAESRS